MGEEFSAQAKVPLYGFIAVGLAIRRAMRGWLWGKNMLLKSIAVLAMLALGLAQASAQTRDDNWARCTDNNPDLSIGGCTAIIQSGAEDNEGLARAFHNRGISYEAKHQYEKAIADYTQSLKLRPNVGTVFRDRGDVYLDQRQLDRAIADFTAAIKLDSQDEIALRKRGLTYIGQGQDAKAKPDLDQALKLDPKDSTVYFGFAMLDLLGHRDAAAIEHLTQSLKYDSDYVDALQSRGDTYQATEAYDKAIDKKKFRPFLKEPPLDASEE